jgi:putative nucleotidyltransferase with HDIG domain
MSSVVSYSPFATAPAAPLLVETSLVDALARTMYVRDRLTHDHSERVRDYALELAAEADVRDELTLAAIRTAAVVHDVGKLGIPDRVLQKAGPLTAEEYEIVKQHATIGADLMAAAGGPGLLPDIVRHHHENWDGSGYPYRLAGDAIPVGARVIAIVDGYDALTSDRPYRRALSHNSALAMIHERRATMYDPRMIDAFMRVLWRRSTVANRRLCQYRVAPKAATAPQRAGQ